MRKILIFILLVSVSTIVEAQRWKFYRYEASLGIGTANGFFDVGGTASESSLLGLKDIDVLSTRPVLFFGTRYKITQNMAVSVRFHAGYFNSTDEDSKNPTRGYVMNVPFFEPTAQFEYSILSEDKRVRSAAVFNRRGMVNNYASIGLYGFAGLGGIVVKPSIDEGKISSSHSVKTTLHTAAVASVGIGIKKPLNKKLIIGVEIGGRYALSDYVEGLTTKFSSHNDVYYFGTASINYKIRTSRRGYPQIFRK